MRHRLKKAAHEILSDQARGLTLKVDRGNIQERAGMNISARDCRHAYCGTNTAAEYMRDRDASAIVTYLGILLGYQLEKEVR